MSDIEARLREVAGTATRGHALDRRSLMLGAEDCARLVELLDEARRDRDLYKRDFEAARDWRDALEEERDEARRVAVFLHDSFGDSTADLKEVERCLALLDEWRGEEGDRDDDPTRKP